MNTDSDKTIYNIIHLPNGGAVMMDKSAYESYQGGCSSSYKKKWKVTLDFEGSEKAVMRQHEVIEIR